MEPNNIEVLKTNNTEIMGGRDGEWNVLISFKDKVTLDKGDVLKVGVGHDGVTKVLKIAKVELDEII